MGGWLSLVQAMLDGKDGGLGAVGNGHEGKDMGVKSHFALDIWFIYVYSMYI